MASNDPPATADRTQIPQSSLRPPQITRVASIARIGLHTSSLSFSSFHADNVRNALQPDLDKFGGVSFQKFLYHALMLVGAVPRNAHGVLNTEEDFHESLKPCLEQIVAVMNDNGSRADMVIITNNIREYCKKSLEADRYEPFVQATNTALHLLRNVEIMEAKVVNDLQADYLVFMCHYGTPIQSDHAGKKYNRRPDVACTSKKNVLPLYAQTKGWTANTPVKRVLKHVVTNPVNSLDWKKIYGCVELKSGRNPLDITQPQYDVRYAETPLQHYDYLQNKQMQKPEAKQPVNDPDTQNKHMDGTDQCAENAAEMFYNTIGRNHIRNLTVDDQYLRVWFFDHEGPILTTAIDFITDFPYFLLLLYALQRFTPSDWGYIDILQPANADTPSSPAIDLVDFGDELWTIASPKATRKTNMFIRDTTGNLPWHRQFSLGGRSTHVIHGRVGTLDVVLKLSWREVSRASEGTILKEARRNLIKHGAEDVCDYLPTCYADKEFEETSTCYIRQFLGFDLTPKGARCAYVIILPSYNPITTRVNDWPKLWDDILTLMYCHFMLWEVAEIEHRDISLSNIMWDPATKKPKLCDFDLSQRSGVEGPVGYTHTGTWMFMSDNLLIPAALGGEVKRIYRHDVESFIAVIVWLMFCSEHKKYNKDAYMVKTWNQAEPALCASNRKHTYTQMSKMACPQHIPNMLWQGIAFKGLRALDTVSRGSSALIGDQSLYDNETFTTEGRLGVQLSSEQKAEFQYYESTDVIEDFLGLFDYGSEGIQKMAVKIQQQISNRGDRKK